MKFNLEINIGSDAVLTYDDIAAILKRYAGILDGSTAPVVGEGVRLFDINGNTVGNWKVSR